MKCNKIIQFLILNIIIVIITSKDPCESPVECYSIAINQIKDCVSDARRQTQMYMDKFRTLESKLDELTRKNDDLKAVVAKHLSF